MNMEWLISLLMPPLVGAFIGFMTNYLAIRMLFRPLRAWRVFGIRIPLTPGIIPARRDELAARMGRTVGHHLVTVEDAAKALEKDVFQVELRQAIEAKANALLNSDYGPVQSLLPRHDRTWADGVLQVATTILTDTVFEYLEGQDFEKQVRRFVEHKADEILSRQVEDLLSEEDQEIIAAHIQSRLTDSFASDEFSQTVARFVDRELDGFFSSEKSLNELLPQEAAGMLFGFVEQELPLLLERISALLEDPEVRQRLAERLEAVIGDLIQSLGGLSRFLAGLVDPKKISARIPEFLDKSGEQIGEWLNEAATRKQIAAKVREWLQEMLDTPVKALVERFSPEKMATVRSFLREQAVKLARSSAAPDLAASALLNALKRIREQSMRSLLEYALPANGLDHATDMLIARMMEASRTPAAREAITDVIRKQLAHLWYDKPIGRLGDRIPPDLRRELPGIVYGQVLDILRSELPPLVKSLNVEKMVEDNVNALPLLEVEEMLLTIMHKHFWYINLFGGVLGFLIGFLNIFW